MGDTWISDLRHFLADDGNVASFPGKGLAEHLCRIVGTVTLEPGTTLRATTLACRLRPGRQACPGRIQAGFDGATSRIRWLCPSCGDNGWISGWHGTQWDKGARGALPSIRQVSYRRGFIRTLDERSRLPVLLLKGTGIPREILVAIRDNDLLGVAGEFGNPDVGEPIQYDELTIEQDGGADTMIVFNRAIMLFKTTDEFFVRFHRVACLIDKLASPDQRLQRAPGPSGDSDNVLELRPRRRGTETLRDPGND